MLIKCRECELQVSNLAEFCPHCGCPVPHEENEGRNKRRKRAKIKSFYQRLEQSRFFYCKIGGKMVKSYILLSAGG